MAARKTINHSTPRLLAWLLLSWHMHQIPSETENWKTEDAYDNAVLIHCPDWNSAPFENYEYIQYWKPPWLSEIARWSVGLNQSEIMRFSPAGWPMISLKMSFWHWRLKALALVHISWSLISQIIFRCPDWSPSIRPTVGIFSIPSQVGTGLTIDRNRHLQMLPDKFRYPKQGTGAK